MLKGCSVRLARFSSAMLAAMDEVVPADLPSPVECTVVPKGQKVMCLQIVCVGYSFIIKCLFHPMCKLGIIIKIKLFK